MNDRVVIHLDNEGVADVRLNRADKMNAIDSAMIEGSPFVEKMVAADQGVIRFIYETIDLKPFEPEEARQFLDDKFGEVIRSAEEDGLAVRIDPAMIDRIAQLSGGHPHLLQLLGSHVIEHEYENPDGVIDNADLVGSLQKICFQKRAPVYDALIHDMKTEDHFESYLRLLELMGGEFPGRAASDLARKQIGKAEIDWLRSRNIIVSTTDDTYEVVDELLRVRVLMDLYEDYDAIEAELLVHGELRADSRILDQLWDLEDPDKSEDQ